MSSLNISVNDTADSFNQDTTSSIAHMVLCVVVIFITIFGTLANVLVIYVFCRIYSANRITINVLIITTAVYDAALIAVAGPIHAASFIVGKWYLGHFNCQFYGFWVHFTSVSSLTNLVVIAIERYAVIKNNVIKDTKPFAIQALLAVVSLGYGIFWASLPLLGWSSYTLEGLSTGCAPNWVSHKMEDVTYNVTLMVSEFILPLSIIITAYVNLLKMMRRHNKVISRMEANQANEVKRKSLIKSTIRLITLMVSAFVISWLPYTIFCLFAIILGPKHIPALVAAIPAIFAKSSVIWNPIIYAMKHNTFKQYLARLWENLRARSGLIKKVHGLPVGRKGASLNENGQCISNESANLHTCKNSQSL